MPKSEKNGFFKIQNLIRYNLNKSSKLADKNF